MATSLQVAGGVVGRWDLAAGEGVHWGGGDIWGDRQRWRLRWGTSGGGVLGGLVGDGDFVWGFAGVEATSGVIAGDGDFKGVLFYIQSCACGLLCNSTTIAICFDLYEPKIRFYGSVLGGALP
ncbi:hypothetical protein TIFTF001_006529 [Ficus carica]|uniref:Uncharacterized protein n=1 Tax=Ficus carica TaxID=3494 RepID=A0AA87ZJ33_FICCA|nr:hypothetical protein TIFTF001_006529 [Ficus carica]